MSRGGLAAAGKGSDRGVLLRALLVRLTEAVEDAGPEELASLASLARQINAVSKDLDALPAKDRSVVDDIAAKRAARRAAAKG